MNEEKERKKEEQGYRRKEKAEQDWDYNGQQEQNHQKSGKDINDVEEEEEKYQ